MRWKEMVMVFVGLMFCYACNEKNDYVPKPRLYPKIVFPEKKPVKVNLDYCNFTFDFPNYAKAIQDSFYFEEQILDKCWFDLVIPELNGRLHCSYIELKDRNHFDEMVKDAFELVVKHNVKANYRDEKRIDFDDRNVYGMQFEIDGPVASAFQFYLTDSIDHFLRGSLYFKDKVDPDSIAPIYQYVKNDIENMIVSFRWK